MDSTYLLPEDLQSQLELVAEQEGTSVNAELVQAVSDHLARRQKERVMARVKKTVERDASLLARLAE